MTNEVQQTEKVAEQAAEKAPGFAAKIKEMGGRAKAFAQKHKAALIAAGVGTAALGAGYAAGRHKNKKSDD